MFNSVQSYKIHNNKFNCLFPYTLVMIKTNVLVNQLLLNLPERDINMHRAVFHVNSKEAQQTRVQPHESYTLFPEISL